MSESPRERIPSYVAAMTVFGSMVATVVGTAWRRGAPVPSTYSVLDIVTGGVATHKFARLLSKDGVTTPLRAPFTEFDGETGSAEVEEHPRDEHPQHTIGELLTCPFCLAPWIATAYVSGLVLAPRAARSWATTFTVVGISDFLQQAYGRVRTD
jgi:Protein of unknown function (DUF1360)